MPDGDLAARIVGPPMDDTLRAMGLGERADAAIAAYRADYGTRGWAMNTPVRRDRGACWPTCGPRASGWRWPPPRLEPTARRILAHFGLDEHFEVIAGASPDGSARPRPRCWRTRWLSWQPLPERVLMVGDRSHDVEGAAAHGIDTVVVGWGYGQADFADGEAATRRRPRDARSRPIDELRRALGV